MLLSHMKSTGGSPKTPKKYAADARHFLQFVGEREISAERNERYKAFVVANNPAATARLRLIGANKYLEFIGFKPLIDTRDVHANSPVKIEKPLTSEEYSRLVKAAKLDSDERLPLILETICSLGLSISELQFITAEAAKMGEVKIGEKRILFPDSLSEKLVDFCDEKGIFHGSIFITRNGKPMDRSNIFRKMKSLCNAAQVDEDKLFPKNLKRLYLSTRQSLEKEIVERMGLA